MSSCNVGTKFRLLLGKVLVNLSKMFADLNKLTGVLGKFALAQIVGTLSTTRIFFKNMAVFFVYEKKTF